MDTYRYTAKNLAGNKVRGVIQAEDEESAYHKIRSSEYYVVRIRKIHKNTRRKPFTAGQLSKFCDQLASMLGSGISLSRAVGIMIAKRKPGYEKEVCQRIYEALLHGSSFSGALAEQSGVFPPLFIGMFRAGEAGGQLEYSARRLAGLYKKENRLRKRLKTTMLYPAFLLVMTMISLIMIFTMILPEFFELFDSMEILPLSTRILMSISNGMVHYPIPLSIGAAAIVVIGSYAAQIEAVKMYRDRMVLKLPVSGRLVRTISTAQFARTLGLLYANGLPLVQALEISSGVIANRYVEAQFDEVIEAVKDGSGLSAALSRVDGLEEDIITAIFIGEEAGKLDMMLENAADSFEFEANEAAIRLASLAEPAVIILLAVLVGTIMLSVMLPVYQYYQIMAG